MKRHSYLSVTHVAGFVNWLATELESHTLFQHSYNNRRNDSHWSCASLYHAYESYSWNHPGNARLGYTAGDCTTSNALALEALRRDLQTAIGDDALCLQASVDVMAWGGVTARNTDWLKTKERGLANMLLSVKKAIDAQDPELPVLCHSDLRFNSGMTKIYSLICDNFVIYDSRVAAALGWLVAKYCQAKGLTQVPKELCFPWAAAKESENTSTPKRRNPAVGGLYFMRLRSGRHHALWNMRASWVLSAALSHPAAHASRFNTCIAAPTNPLRALEAALFMIGYDLA